MDVTQLRRGIGYVIQQVGLFPHMTVADNVATVPRLLGQPRDQIQQRVDELLDLVDLPASTTAAASPLSFQAASASASVSPAHLRRTRPRC